MSPILVTLTSRCDSNFECLNISFSENKMNGFDLSSNGVDNCVGKNGGKIQFFYSGLITHLHVSYTTPCGFRTLTLLRSDLLSKVK